jgi:hypothetical protein
MKKVGSHFATAVTRKATNHEFSQLLGRSPMNGRTLAVSRRWPNREDWVNLFGGNGKSVAGVTCKAQTPFVSRHRQRVFDVEGSSPTLSACLS